MLQCSECTAGEIRMASPRPTPQLYPDRRVHSKHGAPSQRQTVAREPAGRGQTGDGSLDFRRFWSQLEGMATTVDQVATDALGLPTRSRVLLVEKLLASLVGETHPAMERAHLDEIHRRRAAVRAGDSKLVDGDEAMKQVRSAVGK